jgi:hypothetical protein
MLSDLPNLRCLNLQGNSDPHLAGGYLTNRMCEFIMEKYTDLQAIDLFYQWNMTTDGMARVLKHCQHLCQLHASATSQNVDYARLVQLAPKLLIFGNSVMDPDSERGLKEAIKAMCG